MFIKLSFLCSSTILGGGGDGGVVGGVDVGCCILMLLCLFSVAGLSENGGGVQRSGRRGHHWSGGGLPQYDCLQKSKAECMSCCMFPIQRWWPTDRRLTAHWSVSVCIYHKLVPLSIFPTSSHFIATLGNFSFSSALISSQSHHSGPGRWEVILVSRAIISSPWHLALHSCCLIGERWWYWWLITWMWFLGGSSWYSRARTGNRPASGLVIPPQPMNGLLFLCQRSDSPVYKKKAPFDQP